MQQEFTKSKNNELVVKEAGAAPGDKGAVMSRENLEENIVELEKKIAKIEIELASASSDEQIVNCQRELTLHQEALDQKKGWKVEADKLGVVAINSVAEPINEVDIIS